MVFDQLTVFAPGLLGASIAMAVRRNGLARRIHIYARRAETRAACLAENWCDDAFAEAAPAARGSDLLIVCLPVDGIVPLLASIRSALQPKAIITDVGSTKSRICREGAAIIGNSAHFIGSHPMAGSEKSGLQAATPDLFAGRACIVTPLESSCPQATQQVIRFWRNMAMEVSVISPERHDEIVANISHLPHFIASALALHLHGKPDTWVPLAGNGLRDTSRIAAGDPSLWGSIFEQNRDEVLRAISEFEHTLARMKSCLHNEEGLQLRSLLATGKDFRDKLS